MLLGWAVFPRVHEELVSSEEEKVVLYAGSLAAELGTSLGAALSELTATAALPSLKSDDRDVRDRALLDLETASPFFRHLTVLSPDGVVLSRPAIPEHVGESRIDRPYMEAIRDGAELFIGEPRLSSRDNLSLNVAVPVPDANGALGCVLMGSLGLADRNPLLYSPVVNRTAGDPWQAFVMSGDGYLLAHSGRSVTAQGGLAGIDNRSHPARATGEELRRYEHEGQRFVGVAARVPHSSWVAVAQIPEAELLAPVNSLVRSLLLAAALIAVLVLISGGLMAGRLGVRLSMLTSALDEYAASGSARPLREGGGDEVAAAASAFNHMVAERERLGAEIRERDAQLLQAGKMEALGRLAGGVAHDFNNVLTVVQGQAELMLLEELTRECQESLESITKAAEHGRQVTGRLLSFSRRQDGGRQEPTDLREVVRAATELVQPLLRAGTNIRTELPTEPATVIGNGAQLQQLVVNLLVNASDAMPRGGDVIVSVNDGPGDGGSPDTVVLSVADTGEGIADEDVAHIFQPFFTTKPPGEGTGLGLSMAHQVVAAMGGSISVDSAPGEGTRFALVFPGQREPEEADESHSQVGVDPSLR